VGRKLVLPIIAAALVAGAANAGVRDNPAPANASAASVVSDLQLQAQLLGEINDLRRSHGLRALRPNKALAVAAVGHTQSMAKFGFFGHEGHDGLPFWARIKPKYRPQPGHSWRVAENLAWASPELSAERVIQLWMDSPPHRKNLLAPSWQEVGLGAVRALRAPGVYGGLDVTIITADFGVR
jgi:uncharacterized protein YkwD